MQISLDYGRQLAGPTSPLRHPPASHLFTKMFFLHLMSARVNAQHSAVHNGLQASSSHLFVARVQQKGDFSDIFLLHLKGRLLPSLISWVHMFMLMKPGRHCDGGGFISVIFIEDDYLQVYLHTHRLSERVNHFYRSYRSLV